MNTFPIAFASGDGIGPEISTAVKNILLASEAPLEFVEVTLGQQAYLQGEPTGIPAESWQIIKDSKALLKAPLTTPQGKGYKSVNVTLRKALGLFANIRPCLSLAPVIPSNHPGMNLTIIRENEEDLYSGIEYQQTQEVTQCLKLISRSGSERIVRYAFEFAKIAQHEKVSCISKDNIMKLTDGLFHSCFREIAKEYPDIEAEHWIVDIGAARIATRPTIFQTVVTSNLYGDILSDIAAEVTGSVGLAGSANVGFTNAMFEAVHGSAPDIAGLGLANPSGLLQAALLMLSYLGLDSYAQGIHHAWLCCLEEGVHTKDIANEYSTKEIVGTLDFAQAVINRLGKSPSILKELEIAKLPTISFPKRYNYEKQHKELIGVDIFAEWHPEKLNTLVKALQLSCTAAFELQVITNRGIQVWPNGFPETLHSDHWRCRFILKRSQEISPLSLNLITELMHSCVQNNIDVIKTENLYSFDGNAAFSLPQSL